MLDWLRSCRDSKPFKWLLDKVHERKREKMASVHRVPDGVGQVLAREQALGCVEGLCFLDSVINEHTTKLTKKVRNG